MLRAAGSIAFVPLSAAAQLLGPAVAAFDWSTKVYCTSNFLHAIQQPATPSAGALDGTGHYQRYVGAVLVFASGELLLLSEREAEALQELVWATWGSGVQSSSEPPLLLPLCYARQAMAGTGDPLLLCTQLRPLSTAGSARAAAANAPNSPQQLAAVLQRRLGAKELISARLFNGAASYDSQQQRQVLQELASGRCEEAQELLMLRDQLHMFARSDLERACDVVVQVAR
eukprot:GHUV01007409.1.p2 GENE.GHUV01007409.1~~GHUV01007409.1.p2  ORF type:complete len:229 (+),score=92.49 GHUV01007409.1:757-1443(+)